MRILADAVGRICERCGCGERYAAVVRKAGGGSPGRRMFVGARLRRLRDERGLSQAALARRIDLSTSYVNQLENDQRPLTVPVLLTLSREFDLDADYFAPGR